MRERIMAIPGGFQGIHVHNMVKAGSPFLLDICWTTGLGIRAEQRK